LASETWLTQDRSGSQPVEYVEGVDKIESAIRGLVSRIYRSDAERIVQGFLQRAAFSAQVAIDAISGGRETLAPHGGRAARADVRRQGKKRSVPEVPLVEQIIQDRVGQ
jgi:hypothetical protein